MTRVPSVLQTERAVSPLVRMARKLTMTGSVCGNCGSDEIRLSHQRTVVDALLERVFVWPFRCQVCRIRFYRLWRPSARERNTPLLAELLMMPARNLQEDGSVERSSAYPSPLDLTNHRHPHVEPYAMERTPVETNLNDTLNRIPPAHQPLLGRSHGRILILEDDLSIRRLLRRLLDRRGYSASEVAQADDLYRELREGPVDLVVVDISLNGRAGFEAMAVLSQAHPSLKVLALSSGSPEGYTIPGRLVALPKPFPLDRFVESVDALLAHESPTANKAASKE
jgi:CheY-like chemotaxis protein